MKAQSGVFLLEALIGLLVFAVGALGVIAMQAAAISAQSDAQYRIEAGNLADQIIGTIQLKANRSNSANLVTSLAAFSHHPTGSPADCSFSGTASTDSDVTAWATAAAKLPGTTSAMTQILVNTASGSYNSVTVTICWQPAAGGTTHRHTVTAYIN